MVYRLILRRFLWRMKLEGWHDRIGMISVGSCWGLTIWAGDAGRISGPVGVSLSWIWKIFSARKQTGSTEHKRTNQDRRCRWAGKAVRRLRELQAELKVATGCPPCIPVVAASGDRRSLDEYQRYVRRTAILSKSFPSQALFRPSCKICFVRRRGFDFLDCDFHIAIFI
jgi:hypothetical protein